MKKHILQENYEKMFGSIKEGWWDNMSDAAKKSYIKKHGSAPNVAGDDDYDMGEVPGSRELDDTPEDDSEKGSSLTSAPGRVPDEDDEEGGEPEGKTPQAPKDGQAALGVVDKINDFESDSGAGLYDLQDEYDLSDDDVYELKNIGFDFSNAGEPLEDDQIAKMQDKINDLSPNAKKALESEFMSGDEEPTGRTGKELDQETITVDGKQFRRMSEGVEKQPKPKYEFSEFYQRFKR